MKALRWNKIRRGESVNISGNYTFEEELESLEKALRSDKFHPMVLVVMLENLGIIMENYKDNDNIQIKINELLNLVEEYGNRK